MKLSKIQRSFNTNSPAQKAWVVFTPNADRFWLKLLRPGYRHCFILLMDGENWISIDPMLHCTEVKVNRHVPIDFDFPTWLKGRGYDVMQARMTQPVVSLVPFFRPLTCVESVKRILGLKKWWLFTPWQLRRFLSQEMRPSKPDCAGNTRTAKIRQHNNSALKPLSLFRRGELLGFDFYKGDFQWEA